MIPDIEKIEHLLNAKPFEQLDMAERELVLAHLSGKAEYEHMRETLLRVKKVFTAEAATLQAETDMKEYILNRFEQNKPNPVSLFDRISTFFGTLIPSPVGRFSAALSLLLVIIAVGFVMWPRPHQEMAVAEEPKKEAVPASTMTEQAADQQPMVQTKELESEHQVQMQTYGPVNEETNLITIADEAPSMGAGVPLEEAKPKAEISAKVDKEQEGTLMPVTAQSQQPLYRADDKGYLEYSNNVRTASVESSQKASDRYKDISFKNKSQNGIIGNASSRPEKMPTLRGGRFADSILIAEKKANNKGKQDDLNADIASGFSTYTYSDQMDAVSIPVWPGLENNTDAYAATTQKIKDYVVGNYTSSYAYGDADKKSVTEKVTLQLTFSHNGQVIKAVVQGQMQDEVKKEIEKKLLTMPRFKFTGGSRILLEQTYSF